MDRWLAGVALRKESVDRNIRVNKTQRAPSMSLSARRAWIEMPWLLSSVSDFLPSLSARRAWIEMFTNPGSTTLTFVALRKESVDRNLVNTPSPWAFTSRSPQGERG